MFATATGISTALAPSARSPGRMARPLAARPIAMFGQGKSLPAAGTKSLRRSSKERFPAKPKAGLFGRKKKAAQKPAPVEDLEAEGSKKAGSPPADYSILAVVLVAVGAGVVAMDPQLLQKIP